MAAPQRPLWTSFSTHGRPGLLDMLACLSVPRQFSDIFLLSVSSKFSFAMLFHQSLSFLSLCKELKWVLREGLFCFFAIPSANLQHLKDSLAGDPHIQQRVSHVGMSTFFPSKHLLFHLCTFFFFFCRRQLSSGLEKSPVNRRLLLEHTADRHPMTWGRTDHTFNQNPYWQNFDNVLFFFFFFPILSSCEIELKKPVSRIFQNGSAIIFLCKTQCLI